MASTTVLDAPGASTPTPAVSGYDRSLLMPRAGETVDSYLLRLRALALQIEGLIAAIERGSLSRTDTASAPLVTAPHIPETPREVAAAEAAPQLAAAEPHVVEADVAPAVAMAPPAGFRGRPRSVVPDRPVQLPQIAPPLPPNVPATGDRRALETDRRGGYDTRRKGLDRRIGMPDAREEGDQLDRRAGDRRTGARNRRISSDDRRHQPGVMERGGPDMDSVRSWAFWGLQVIAWVLLFSVVLYVLAVRS